MQSEFRSNLIRTVGKPKKMVLFFIAILMAFTTVFSFSSSVSAASDGTWTDESFTSIKINDQTLVKASDNNLKKIPNEAKGKNTFASSSQANNPNKIYIVAVDKIENETTGKLFEYSIDSSEKYIKKSGPEDIKINGSDKEGNSGCAVEGSGSWLVCGIAGTLAGFMDSVYEILQNFLDVQPLYADDGSALYQVWSYMRNIANILFIILFIVVIYSQITNVGITNYGIKKMLPKIIVAAILINISYFICAILVDISNILGHELQNILLSIRKQVFENSANPVNFDLSWTQLITTTMGGAAALAVGTASFVIQSGMGVFWLSLTGLISVLFSALVAVVVLAARQAIITILIFLAPLAFVANILPNTEKWFEKWKDLFTTMLIMYPMFALLFGGAQLAGTTIIANSNGNAVTLVIGMIVQVVPIAVTPFLIRLSGSLLGKFAGMVNNPNKGPFDMAKNFTRQKAEMARNNSIRKGLDPEKLKDGKPKRGSTAWANQLRYNYNKRMEKQKGFAETSQERAFLDEDSSLIKAARNAETTERRDKLLSKSYQLTEDKLKSELELSKESVNNVISGLKTDISKETFKFDINGNITGLDRDKVDNLSRNLGNYSASLYNTMNSLSAEKLASKNNDLMMTGQFAETLTRSEALKNIAAGARGEEGRTSALAAALSNAAKVSKEEHESLQTLAKSANLSTKDAKRIVDGEEVETDNGFIFSGKKDAHVKMALEQFIKESPPTDGENGIDDVITASQGNGRLSRFRTEVADYYSKYKKDDIQVIGGGGIGALAKGDIDNFTDFKFNSLSKTSAGNFVKFSDDWMRQINTSWDKVGAEQQNALKKAFKVISEDPQALSQLNDKQRNQANSIAEKLGLNDNYFG